MKLKSTAEIDWFDFETRMRIIIRDILEPTIKRQEDDRDEINNLKKMIENFKKRIDDLDYLVNRANFKTSK